MGRRSDPFTADLFSVPTAPTAPGSLHCAREIAAVMADAIKQSEYDRIDIAARMTRLLGEEITVAMINTWTAESKDDHMPNIERAIAFDVATGVNALATYHAKKVGGLFLLGRDALLAEVGRLDQQAASIDRKKRALKQFLGATE